ncbi:hypothetical protein BAnh1_11230 [Bartonella australis AUST/NH1]|uniref:Uncharacterized protein n=1 Tax=Bartonella australis (strain Aust/NH1) TaxID=1094489 RepID=M1PEE6_BARAA|nr:hypothetical protein BAnh1_11230 [Bartonella australis AUST/NH1]
MDINKLILIANLKKYLLENRIPTYKISMNIFKKSPGYLTYKLNSSTIRTDEIT